MGNFQKSMTDITDMKDNMADMAGTLKNLKGGPPMTGKFKKIANLAKFANKFKG